MTQTDYQQRYGILSSERFYLLAPPRPNHGGSNGARANRSTWPLEWLEQDEDQKRLIRQARWVAFGH